MNEKSPVTKCARCGTAVAPDAVDGLCPRCLLALNFVTDTDIPGEAGRSAGGEAQNRPLPPVPTPEALAPHFPQFEILECLGRGGMGAVYKARQSQLDRFVALKILVAQHPDGSADAAFAARFAREARALARLNHPNIVAVYDYGQAGGYPFLVMEYVEGVTLRQLLQSRKLTPEEALAIVPKICEALQFAHQKGIVHRDIKPENILLDKSGQVKITDFGIAKVIHPGALDHSLTGAKDVVGTPHYMAPEQVEDPLRVDHRADIFSLGVVFYEMLTGELPLGKFQPPSNKVRLDVRLDEVVLRALAKEPERRYQQASQVKTAVETIAHSTLPLNGATASPSLSDMGKGGKDQKRRPLAAAKWPMIGTAALLAVGLGWLVWPHPSLLYEWMRPSATVRTGSAPGVQAHAPAAKPSRPLRKDVTLRQPSPADVQIAPALSFGPAVDLQLVSNARGKRTFIDMDTGKVLEAPTELTERLAAGTLRLSSPEVAAWMRSSGADLVCELTKPPGLVQLGGSVGLAGRLQNPETGRTIPKLVDQVTPEEAISFARTIAPKVMELNSQSLWQHEPATANLFLTREGGIGALEITGYTENPPGVKIRYKLVQATPTSSVTQPDSPPAVFGLQAERTVTASDVNRDGIVAFEFKAKRLVTPPVALTGNFNNSATLELTPELKQWMRASNVDLLLHLKEKSYDVLTLDMRDGFAGQPKTWDTILPAQVFPVLARLEALNTQAGLGISSGCGYRDGLSHVHVFRTRAGLVGCYQLRGLDDLDGRGVQIRYKVLEKTGGGLDDARDAGAGKTSQEVEELPPSLTNASFAPIIEQTLTRNQADDQGFVFFSLRAARHLKPPFALSQRLFGSTWDALALELQQWIRTNDVDVLVQVQEDRWAMRSLEMDERPLGAPDQWERLTSQQVVAVFNREAAYYPQRLLGGPFLNESREQFTPCTAFRTRHKAIGVWQAAGIAGPQPGVKIRYRLIQPKN